MTQAELKELTRLFIPAKQQHPEWRDGQSWMNALSVVNMDVFNLITGTAADCFYQDSRIGIFFLTIYNPLISIKEIDITYR